jgi:hypothetical protein
VGVVAGAALGLAVFALMAYRAVTIETAELSQALDRFTRARTALPRREPLLTLEEAGHVVKREEPLAAAPAPIRRLGVLAYHAETQRLATADVPFWFLELKGPAARLALHNTGFDLERLGITPAELVRHGPSIVIDWVGAKGDRLLVWTE